MVIPANGQVIPLARIVMASSSEEETDIWQQRGAFVVNDYPVMLRREQQVQQSLAGRQRALHHRREEFIEEHELERANGPSLIQTSEAQDLHHWCEHQS